MSNELVSGILTVVVITLFILIPYYTGKLVVKIGIIGNENGGPIVDFIIGVFLLLVAYIFSGIMLGLYLSILKHIYYV